MISTKTRTGLGRTVAAVAALSLIAAACGGDDDDDAADEVDNAEQAVDDAVDEAEEAVDDLVDATDEEAEDLADDVEGALDDVVDCETNDEISIQMQWVTQAQFAGYYAADSLGYYDELCLDVTIVEGGTDIPPQQQVANGDVDFATSWVSKALATREAGANIVNIAQIFQRSGTLQISFVDLDITSPEDFAGQTVGNWGFGNEYEVFAALGQAGLDPATDVTLVQQAFDMDGFLAGDIAAAEAMTYNEYAQVLESVNPDTGELYTPEDLNVISYSDIGVGMLQDAIWADGDRLANDPEYKDIATRLVAGSMRGWLYCRDNVQECTDIVLAAGPTLGASHQLWQMNEVNKLIWPSEEGIGYIIQEDWDRTVDLSLNTPNLEGATVLTEPPTEGAYTNEIVEAAWVILSEAEIPLHMQGSVYDPIDVTLEEGGN
jgi:NitT/TauT family transport system substrate-binding protein